jgi:hypothetical protein
MIFTYVNQAPPLPNVAQLCRLIERNDLPGVCRWLSVPGANADQPEADGLTPIFCAAQIGVKFDIFAAIVSTGARLCDFTGSKNLVYAVCYETNERDRHFSKADDADQLRKVKLAMLLQPDQITATHGRDRQSAFCAAASNCAHSIVNYMHSVGVSDPRAITEGAFDYRMLTEMLSWGYDPKANTEPDESPLFVACNAATDPRCAELLVSLGADVGWVSKRDLLTPLQGVAYNTRMKRADTIRLARLLISKGARVDQKNPAGFTLVSMAISSLNGPLAAEMWLDRPNKAVSPREYDLAALADVTEMDSESDEHPKPSQVDPTTLANMRSVIRELTKVGFYHPWNKEILKKQGPSHLH